MKGIHFVLASLLAFCFAVGTAVAPSFAQTTEQIARGNCKACADVCQETLNYCVKKKGRHGQQTVTNALKDCITSCKATGEFLARGTAYDSKSAALTVEACLNCAKTVEAFDDNVMKACANECRKTAGNLQKVAARNTSAKPAI